MQIEGARITGGELWILGSTDELETDITLDGGFPTKTDRRGNFEFRVVYHPATCIATLRTPKEERGVVVGECGQKGPPGPSARTARPEREAPRAPPVSPARKATPALRARKANRVPWAPLDRQVPQAPLVLPGRPVAPAPRAPAARPVRRPPQPRSPPPRPRRPQRSPSLSGGRHSRLTSKLTTVLWER